MCARKQDEGVSKYDNLRIVNNPEVHQVLDDMKLSLKQAYIFIKRNVAGLKSLHLFIILDELVTKKRNKLPTFFYIVCI